MMRSLYAGVSGLKNHQTRMDVIGNNIANVNTIGFKKSRVIFQDMLSQTMQNATAPTTKRGGTNPLQVGLGMTLASIDVLHTPGSSQSTGKNTDLSIDGDGYFMIGDGENTYYTRAGNFDLDTNHTFFHGGSGLVAKGILADNTGIINPTALIENIYLERFVASPARATTNVNFAKNIDSRVQPQIETSNCTHTNGSDTVVNVKVPFSNIVVTDAGGNQLVEGAADGYSIDYATGELTINANATDGDYSISYFTPNYSLSVLAYDSKGNTHTVNIHFAKIDHNEWAVSTSIDNTFVSSGQGMLVFDPNSGDLISSTVNNTIQTIPGADELNFSFNFKNIKEYAENFTITYTGQDGYSAGYLEEVSVDSSGIIKGSYSNGESRQLAQLTIATFTNPAGLTKVGNNLYTISNNSGKPDEGIPGASGRGTINPETLEMSNVDLSEEFVDMITTQRGFQANSRVITTSDQILEELVNLRR